MQWKYGFIAGICIAASAAAQTGDLPTRVEQLLASTADLEAAKEALQAKNFRKLEELLNDATHRQPSPDRDFLAVKAAVEFVALDMNACIATYKQALALGPLSESDTFTYAMALANRGDVEDARHVVEKLSNLNPQKALYLYWLGRFDYYERRYDSAVDKLKRAAELDPQSVRVWDSLGLSYDMLGRNTEAEAAFRRAVDLNRREAHPSPWPPNNLGSLLLRVERASDAEQALRESLRYDPGLMQAHYRLGRALEKQNRLSEAEQEYRISVKGDTTSSDACYALAFLLRKANRKEEADAMFAEFRARKQHETTDVSTMEPSHTAPMPH
jgi:tetratricopeptide (TPR) repeat protein